MSALAKYCKMKGKESPKMEEEMTGKTRNDNFEVPEPKGDDHEDEYKGGVAKYKKKAKAMEMHK